MSIIIKLFFTALKLTHEASCYECRALAQRTLDSSRGVDRDVIVCRATLVSYKATRLGRLRLYVGVRVLEDVFGNLMLSELRCQVRS